MNNRRELVIALGEEALVNRFTVEFMDWISPDLFEHPPQCENAWFSIPVRPGHGMALASGARENYQAGG